MISKVGAASLQRQAVRGSLWSLLATVVSLPVSLLSVVIAGRFLGPAGFGTFSLYAFYVVIGLLVIDLGITSSQTWEATAGRAADPKLLKASLRACVTWSMCKLPIALLAAAWLLDDEPGAALLLGVGLAAQLLGQALALAVTADRNYAALARISLVNTVVGSLGMGLAAVVTGSPGWTLAGFWAGRIATTPMLLRSTPPELRRTCAFPGTMRMTRTSAAFGGSSYLSSLMATWVAGRSELIFLERAGGGEPLGRFALATTVAARVTLLADALYGALGIAMLAVRSADSARFVEAFVRALRLTTLLAMSTTVLVTAGAALLAPPLFGEEYGPVVLPTALLVQVALLRTAWQPLFSWIYTERVNKALLIPGAVAVAVDVALCLLLIPRGAFLGAVTAYGASAVVFLVTAAWAAGLPAAATRELVRCTARFLLVAASATGMVLLPWPWTGPVALLLHAVASTCLGLAVCAVLLRTLPPLFGVDEMESITASLPARLRSPFRLVNHVLGGARRGASDA